jgi:uncharacterized Tic20 family protein
MNPFKILQIIKMVKEARANPAGFSGEQAREVLWGIFIIPIIICMLVLVAFFLAGYTDVLGFQVGFFKFLFWLALFVSFAIFSVIRRIISSLGKGASMATKKVVETVGQEVGDEKGV